ncbi:MAG: NAD(P)/FAD-dependent oxidoreductase [Anaerolineae bacterium]
MQHSKYVIIGGGLAGGSAAEGIRKVDTEGSVTLITRENHRPYQRPPLSKGYLQGRQGLNKVYLQDETYYSQNKIALRLGSEVARIDRTAHLVALADGSELEYERLLLATGGLARLLPIPGSGLRGVHLLRTIEDSDAIKSAIKPKAPVVVLGGSFIGCEVAASLSLLGAQVTMLFPEKRVLERVAVPDLSKVLEKNYADHGVDIKSGITSLSFEGCDALEYVHLSDGGSLPASLVVMGVGIRLDTRLAQDAGLELDHQGAVLVNEYLVSSDPDIYAAGDIASWPSELYGKRLRVEHWDVALNQGLAAGRNMAGAGEPYGVLPYFFSDIYDFSFDAYGDISTWDAFLLRGSLEAGSYAYFYFRDKVLVAALMVNRPKAEGKTVPALIEARLSYDKLVDVAANEDYDLAALLPA